MIGRNIRHIRQICQILLNNLYFGKTQLTIAIGRYYADKTRFITRLCYLLLSENSLKNEAIFVIFEKQLCRFFLLFLFIILYMMEKKTCIMTSREASPDFSPSDKVLHHLKSRLLHRAVLRH